MTDTPHTRLEAARDRVGSLTVAHVIVAVVLCSTVLMGAVIAQTETQTFDDDFEDGDIDGWTSDNPTMSVSSTSINGEHSLTMGTDSTDRSAEWTDGPVLDLQDSFEVTGTFRPQFNTAMQSSTHQIRLGVEGEDNLAEGENALILFDEMENATYLGTYATDELNSSQDRINNDFDGQWVNFRISSEEGSDTLNAKVWAHGNTEPTDPQLSETFDGVSGTFAVMTGTAEETDREIWLDSVTIEGSEAIDPQLNLDTPTLLRHGQTATYSVDYTESVNGNNRTADVTDESHVESLNSSGITVDQDNNEITATEDTEFNDRVEIRAEYNGSVTYNEVAVAEVTLENADILPTMFRFSALINDGNFFFILLATLAGVVGTRWSTSFGGLGFFETVIVIGWFGGWVQGGLMLVSVFFAGFIGLNLAANIDYTVRR